MVIILRYCPAERHYHYYRRMFATCSRPIKRNRLEVEEIDRNPPIERTHVSRNRVDFYNSPRMFDGAHLAPIISSSTNSVKVLNSENNMWCTGGSVIGCAPGDGNRRENLTLLSYLLFSPFRIYTRFAHAYDAQTYTHFPSIFIAHLCCCWNFQSFV